MKANIIHGDFNPCGGAERLSLVTMKALLEMNIDFDLTTLKTPNITKLENTYGKNLVSVMEEVKQINVTNIMEELGRQQQENDQDYNYDVTINTNGDAAPYYHRSFSKHTAITYCHFPSTKYHIESRNIEYLKTDLGMTAEEDPDVFLDNNNNNNNNNNHEDITAYNLQEYQTRLQLNNKVRRKRTKQECFELIEYGYLNLMRSSIVITNSEYSRRAIANAFGSENTHVLSPPIDIETFQNVALIANGPNEKNHTVVVISRIAPHKQIENAIKLAKILKDKKIGNEMKIVGNLYHYFFEYYSELKQMVIDLRLDDYIQFEINASLDTLIRIIRESRVYFHPMIGDHFGMAVVEAMAAGLIPVVPNKGGPSEFVPQRYQFATLEQAAEIISHVFNVLPKTEQIKINEETRKFSNSHYIERFQRLINELIFKRA
jgi:glycosyltransferase involved in cell wall biosynthesis